MILQFLIILGLTATAKCLRHDDLIIAVGGNLTFLKGGWSERALRFSDYNASKIIALAYDPLKRNLYFSNRRNSQGQVFIVSLQEDGLGLLSARRVVNRDDIDTVEGLTYDPIDNAILWTDGSKNSIRRAKFDASRAQHPENNTVELVHMLDNDLPRGLVSDLCNRILYWTNWNFHHPTIERSYLNGSSKEVIVSQGLFMPHGLGMDLVQQQLYWANNMQLGYFHIERSDVDGSNRQLIHRGIGHFIFSLTVGEDYIYWTDWDHNKLWSLPKEGSLWGPTALHAYEHKPMSVIVFHHQPLMCSRVQLSSITVNTTSLDENKKFVTADEALCSGYCLNNGSCTFADAEWKCSCPHPWSGNRCELFTSSERVCTGVVAPEPIHLPDPVLLFTLSATCVVLFAIAVFLCLFSCKLQYGRKIRRRVVSRSAHRRASQFATTGEAVRFSAVDDCCRSPLCEMACDSKEEPNANNRSQRSPTDTAQLFYEF